MLETLAAGSILNGIGILKEPRKILEVNLGWKWQVTGKEVAK